MAALHDPWLGFMLGASAVGAYCMQRIGANTIEQIAQSRMATILDLPLRKTGRELQLIQHVCGALALVCGFMPFVADFGERESVSNTFVPLTLGLIIAGVGIGWQAWVCWKMRRSMERHDIRRQFTIMAGTLVGTQIFGIFVICGAIAVQWRAILFVKP